MRLLYIISYLITLSLFKWDSNIFVKGYNWDGKLWDILLSHTLGERLTTVNKNEYLSVRSIDAGLFFKDVEENLKNCHYVYSGEGAKEHFLSCEVYIQNYSKKNKKDPYKEKYYLTALFGKDQYPNPECTIEGTRTEIKEIFLYNVDEYGTTEMTNEIGEKHFKKFATDEYLELGDNIKYKKISFNDYKGCNYALQFDKIKITKNRIGY